MFGENVSKTKGRNSNRAWRKIYRTKFKKNDELEERVSYQENTISQLLIKCNDNQQYSRRNCLQTHGVESKKIKK